MSNYPKVTMEDLRNLPKQPLTEEEKSSPFVKFYNQPLADVADEQLAALNGGPCNPQLALPIEKRSDMFLPGEQSVEIGFCKMPDGTGFVANRTFFPGATPEMFDWWMNFHALEGIRIKMWLPNAHLDSYVKEPYLHGNNCGISLATRNWNKEHYATEGLTSLEESGVCCLRFFSPQEFGIDMHQLLVSPVKSHVMMSVMFFGDSLIMFGEEMKKELLAKDPDIKVPFNVLLHTIRPVVGGCEMRSRFWIGKGMEQGVPYNINLPQEAVEGMSWTMLKHTIQEMSNLASFLPEVYNLCGGKVPMPGAKPENL